MKTSHVCTFLTLLFTAGCASQPHSGIDGATTRTVSSSDQHQVSGREAVTIYKGFMYMFEGFGEGAATKIHETVHDVKCAEECTATFDGKQGETRGTMIGAREITALVHKCKSKAATEVTCEGAADKYGQPESADFSCTAFCR